MYSTKYLTNIRSATLGSARFQALIAVAAFLISAIAIPIPVAAQKYSEWSVPAHLGSTINTSGFDGCPFLAKNGLDLLFMSNFGSSDAESVCLSSRHPRFALGHS